jgi:hypothetical protein
VNNRSPDAHENIAAETDHALPTPVLALRPKQAAKALSLGVRKLWELTNRGEIPHIKLDKVILYPVDALRDWLAQQTKGGR